MAQGPPDSTRPPDDSGFPVEHAPARPRGRLARCPRRVPFAAHLVPAWALCYELPDMQGRSAVLVRLSEADLQVLKQAAGAAGLKLDALLVAASLRFVAGDADFRRQLSTEGRVLWGPPPARFAAAELVELNLSEEQLAAYDQALARVRYVRSGEPVELAPAQFIAAAAVRLVAEFAGESLAGLRRELEPFLGPHVPRLTVFDVARQSSKPNLPALPSRPSDATVVMSAALVQEPAVANRAELRGARGRDRSTEAVSSSGSSPVVLSRERRAEALSPSASLDASTSGPRRVSQASVIVSESLADVARVSRPDPLRTEIGRAVAIPEVPHHEALRSKRSDRGERREREDRDEREERAAWTPVAVSQLDQRHPEPAPEPRPQAKKRGQRVSEEAREGHGASGERPDELPAGDGTSRLGFDLRTGLGIGALLLVSLAGTLAWAMLRRPAVESTAQAAEPAKASALAASSESATLARAGKPTKPATSPHASDELAGLSAGAPAPGRPVDRPMLPPPPDEPDEPVGAARDPARDASKRALKELSKVFRAKGTPAGEIDALIRTAYGRPRVDAKGTIVQTDLSTPSKRYDAFIQRAVDSVAYVYPVPAPLVKAIIRRESNFNPEIRSDVGAVGLMQVMPFNAPKVNLTVEDLSDPEKNILAGTRLLAVLLKYYDGDIVNALIAYNAKARPLFAPIPNNGETPGYVAAVLHHLEEYSGPSGLTPSATPH